MVMTIHIVSDEEPQGRSHKCIRRGVPSSRNAGDADSRCQSISQNWKNAMLREFASNDSRERRSRAMIPASPHMSVAHPGGARSRTQPFLPTGKPRRQRRSVIVRANDYFPRALLQRRAGTRWLRIRSFALGHSFQGSVADVRVPLATGTRVSSPWLAS